MRSPSPQTEGAPHPRQPFATSVLDNVELAEFVESKGVKPCCETYVCYSAAYGISVLQDPDVISFAADLMNIPLSSTFQYQFSR